MVHCDPGSDRRLLGYSVAMFVFQLICDMKLQIYSSAYSSTPEFTGSGRSYNTYDLFDGSGRKLGGMT